MSCQTRLLRIHTWIKLQEWIFGFDFCIYVCACPPESVLNVSKEAFNCELLINDYKWVARIASMAFLSFLSSPLHSLPCTGSETDWLRFWKNRDNVTPPKGWQGSSIFMCPNDKNLYPHRNVTRIKIGWIRLLSPDANHSCLFRKESFNFRDGFSGFDLLHIILYYLPFCF